MVGFTIENGKLAIEPEVLTVSAFKRIWDFDKSTKKEKAHNLITYVFTMCDLTQKNPFVDVPIMQKEQVCKKNAFGNPNHKFSKQEQDLIDEAFLWYNSLSETTLLRLAEGINMKIDQITEYLNREDQKVDTDAKLERAIGNMAKIDKLLDAKQKTDKYVRQEFEKIKSQGGLKKSPLQKGLINKRSGTQ